MGHEFAVQLSDILRRLGPSSRDPARLRAALQTEMSASPLKVNLVLQLLEGGMLSDVAAVGQSMDTQKAKDLVKQLMARYGTDPEHAKWTVRVWVEAFRLGTITTQEHTANALMIVKENLKRQKYIESIRELSAAIELTPTAETFMLRGVASYGLLQLAPSINCLLRMIHLPPRVLPQMRGVLENPTFAFFRALDVFQHITRLYSGDHAGAFQEACARSADDLFDTILALSMVTKTFRREANDYGRSILLFLRQNANQADLDFTNVHSEDPQNAQAYCYHGVVLLLRNRLRSAITYLSSNHVVQLDPKDFEPLDIENSWRNQAIIYLTEALRLNSGLYEALYYRAQLYEQSGNYDRALADLDNLGVRDPNHAGMSYIKAGIFEQRKTRSKPDRGCLYVRNSY